MTFIDIFSIVMALVSAAPGGNSLPTQAQNCGLLAAPDNLNIAAITRSTWDDETFIVSAKICDKEFFCNTVASTTSDGKMRVVWAADGRMVVQTTGNNAPVGEQRYRDVHNMPKVEVRHDYNSVSDDFKNRPSLNYVESQCETRQPIGPS
jgi:hypothetical protein